MRPRRLNSPRRLLPITVLAVVVTFVVAHILTVRAASSLRDRSATIQRSVNRIDAASVIRGDMHDLGILLSRIPASPTGPWEDAEEYRAGRHAIEAARDAFNSLPPTPADAPSADEMLRDLANTLSAMDVVASARNSGDAAAAGRIDHGTLSRITDAAIERLVSADAAVTRSATADIAGVERRLKILSPLLDALAVAFALGLTVLTLRATREYVRLSEERTRMAEERADELEMFAGRVAHDLRNPLGSMALRLMALQRREPNQLSAADVAPLSGIVDRMDGIIGELLQFARAGGKPDRDARAEVQPALHAIEDEFGLEAEREGATFIVERPPNAAVACPQSLIVSVLENLIRNALKFLGSGAMRRVTVRAKEKADYVHFEVEDTGPGIPEDLQHVIFDPFVRAQSGPSREGIGLGLATVKRLVDAYGGAVGVQSRVGQGSRFWFELPKAPSYAHGEQAMEPVH